MTARKIMVAGISQETCSFNSVQTTLQDFKDVDLRSGAEVLDVSAGEGVIGAFADLARKTNCILEGIVSAKAMSGGPLSQETFASLKSMLLDGLRKSVGFDAVYLALHGAMAAEDEPDTEGSILADVRELVGRDVFVGVTLDHHANVTREMVEAADLMVGYETQPHDLPASGAKTARVMLDILDGSPWPHVALVKVPMLAPQDNFLTSGGPMKEWFDLAREIEKEPGVIAASPFPTQPWLDAPGNGWSSLVYADDIAKAQECAGKLAMKAWGLREQFWRSEHMALPDLIKAANAETKGLVVVSDTGDAAFGGAPGDNMSIAEEIMKHELAGPALVPVVDPEAFRLAFAAGVGREVTLDLGGRMSAGFSPRLRIAGTVKAVSDAGILKLDDGRSFKVGRAVLLERGKLKLAVMERRDYAINHPSLYQNLGIDVAAAQIAVLKTGSNFQYFRAYQSRLLRADSPGATQSDLAAFTWRNITRPIYPFDNIKDWRP